MSKIKGRAKKFDGTPIDYVSIFNWSDGKCITQTTPEASGKWRFGPYGDFLIGLTYVADGCEPVTHGPYNAEVIPCKYYRLTKITTAATSSPFSISVAEIQFIDNSGAILSANRPAISSRGLVDDTSGRGDPKNAFDGLANTMWHSENIFNIEDQSGVWIGCELLAPSVVEQVGLRMRHNAQANYNQEWQSAILQTSEDGVFWQDYGLIKPSIHALSTSLVISNIEPIF